MQLKDLFRDENVNVPSTPGARDRYHASISRTQARKHTNIASMQCK